MRKQPLSSPLQNLPARLPIDILIEDLAVGSVTDGKQYFSSHNIYAVMLKYHLHSLRRVHQVKLGECKATGGILFRDDESVYVECDINCTSTILVLP